MKSRGEIESEVCNGLTRILHEYFGKGPKKTYSYLLGSMLIVRLQGVLTIAEQKTMKSPHCSRESDHGGGRSVVKGLRSNFAKIIRPQLSGLVEAATGLQLVSLHHDISTATDEELFGLILDGEPECRS